MALGVNTNISSLTAQRALVQADKSLATSMERLSTGLRINTAGDDAAGLAVAERMTSQIGSLNQAVRNANSGITLASTVDGALVEVADMLQRARELSVQASSATVSSSERGFLQDEVTQLMAEIDRIASSTQFNGQNVLDGTFVNQTLQLGGSSAETLTMSVDSASSSQIGSQKLTGDIQQEQLGAGGKLNRTDAADDVVITANGVATTINVGLADSAESVAAKFNAVSGTTGVTAEAQTQALIYTHKTASVTHSLSINGVDTGSFAITSSDVAAGVTAINNISAQTGVTASTTDDNKIKLTSSVGADIFVENKTAGNTDLQVKALGFDGSNEITVKAVHAKHTDASNLTASTTFVIDNETTGVKNNVAIGTTHNQAEYTTLINTALGGTAVGTEGRRVSTDDLSALAAGDYYLKHNSTGDVYKLTTTASTVAAWTSAISSATHANGSYNGDTQSLADRLTASQAGASGAVKLAITGDRVFGDFDIYSDAALTTDVFATATGKITGIEATGIQVVAGDAAHTNAGNGITNIGSVVDVDEIVNEVTALNQAQTVIGSTVTAAAGGEKVALIVTTADTNADTMTAGAEMIVTGTNRDGQSITEVVTLAADLVMSNIATQHLAMATTNDFLTVTGVTTANIAGITGGADSISVGFVSKATTYTYTGARQFGEFDIETTAGVTQLTESEVGDIDSSDSQLAGAGTVTDTVTFQGGINLSSNESFSVLQNGGEQTTAATVANNDNYFTAGASTLSSAGAVNIGTQAGAQSAMAVLDGAIEKVSSIRSSLGALQNRLSHTVSNLMNVSETTTAARATLLDADFSVESANLAKAQVLLQAGTAMLAQANASPQMVLQLLQ